MSMRSVAKPLILNRLENNCQSNCLTSGQKLSAIQLIVFVFNVIHKNFNKNRDNIALKDLYLLIKRYMYRELIAICGQKSRQNACNEEEEESDDKQMIAFNNLFNDFIENKILSIDVNKQTIGFSLKAIKWLSEVQQMLDKCLINVLHNYLTIQLKRFGGRRVDDIEMRLIRCHNYLFHYLFSDQNNYRLIDLIESKPEQLTIRYIDHNSQIDAFVDIKSNNGSNDHQMSSLIGFPYLLNPNNRYIRLKNRKVNELEDFFKIDSNVLQIYGREVLEEDLIQWIHKNDSILFDAQLIRDNRLDMNNNKRYGVHYSWFVTDIHRILHSGECYVSKDKLFSHFQWSLHH